MTRSCHGRQSRHSDHRRYGNRSATSSCCLLSHFGHGKLGVVSVGGHSCVDSKLTLAEKVLEVVEQPDSHWILHVNALHAGEVASSFGYTLTDSHDAVVKESPGVAIGSIWITETWGRGRKEKLSFRHLLKSSDLIHTMQLLLKGFFFFFLVMHRTHTSERKSSHNRCFYFLTLRNATRKVAISLAWLASRPHHDCVVREGLDPPQTTRGHGKLQGHWSHTRLWSHTSGRSGREGENRGDMIESYL